MKTIIGIDNEGAYKDSLTLYRRLDFSKAEVTLLHAVSPNVPFSTFEMMPSVAAPGFFEAAEQVGNELLEAASEEACARGIPNSTKLAVGAAAQCLMDESDAQRADLVVVRAARKGALGSMFLGSTSRGLVIGAKTSTLIVKEDPPKSGPVDTVIATDLSPYSLKCINEFINLEPKGVGKITIVVAYEVNDEEAALLHANVPNLEGKINEFIEGKLREQAQLILGNFAALGYRVELAIEQGDPNEVLRNVMSRTKSELMVVGAQGHGLLERLVIGSCSLHQVIAEPYSVLVLRV